MKEITEKTGGPEKAEKNILDAGKYRRFSLASHINGLHRALTALAAKVAAEKSAYNKGSKGVVTMAKVSPYYSINEANKPKDKQVHHTDDQCRAGRDIPQNERRSGTGGYRHCDDCES
jgi:hypothetical protein